VLVLTLHVAGLAHLQALSMPAPPGSAVGGKVAPRQVRVELLPADQPGDRGAEAITRGTPDTADMTTPVHRPGEDISASSTGAVNVAASATFSRSAEPGASVDRSTPPRLVDADYLPRAALSRPARALDPIEIAYPEGSPAGDYRAVLLLFVDESGKVQRVRLRDPGLPLGLEDAARSAFMAAHFAPGEVDGRAVRSILAVEVNFNAMPQPAGAVSRAVP
jgi:hypothetical protein